MRAMVALGFIGLLCAAPSGCESNEHPDTPETADEVGGFGGTAGNQATSSTTGGGAQTSQSELTKSIADLTAFGTRFTFGQGDELARDYLSSRLKAYGLEVQLDAFSVDDTTATNVIARKTGSVSPEQVYIFSAHYDSTSEAPLQSAPGADDNASAVAAVLEAARILTPHSFEHSLWFVLTAAEEQGSLGSAHMTTWLKAQNVDVQAIIAPDMIGYWPLGDDDAFDILADSKSTQVADQMAAIADQMGVAYKMWVNHDYCYGDDHTIFQESGIPAISPMDCVEAHNLPASEESLPHYHKSTDTLETLYMPFTTKVAGVIIATFATLGRPVAP